MGTEDVGDVRVCFGVITPFSGLKESQGLTKAARGSLFVDGRVQESGKPPGNHPWLPYLRLKKVVPKWHLGKWNRRLKPA